MMKAWVALGWVTAGDANGVTRTQPINQTPVGCPVVEDEGCGAVEARSDPPPRLGVREEKTNVTVRLGTVRPSLRGMGGRSARHTHH